MRRRPKEEKHENHERWLLTYADMITLLMAFFIMMYSMSVLNLSKFRDAAISIRSGFGGIIPGQGRSILGSSGMFSAKPSPIEGDSPGVAWSVVRPLQEYIKRDEGAGRSMSIGQDQRGVVITLLSDKMLFKPGNAELREAAYPALDRVAETLDKLANKVQIVGHTCDLKPSKRSRFHSNLELSLARAQTVLDYFERYKGLDPDRFSMAGYGSSMPVVPNRDEASRRRNRRVEIVILRPEPAPQPPAAARPGQTIRPMPELRRRTNR